MRSNLGSVQMSPNLLLTGRPRSSHLTSLNINFLNYKMIVTLGWVPQSGLWNKNLDAGNSLYGWGSGEHETEMGEKPLNTCSWVGHCCGPLELHPTGGSSGKWCKCPQNLHTGQRLGWIICQLSSLTGWELPTDIVQHSKFPWCRTKPPGTWGREQLHWEEPQHRWGHMATERQGRASPASLQGHLTTALYEKSGVLDEKTYTEHQPHCLVHEKSPVNFWGSDCRGCSC